MKVHAGNQIVGLAILACSIAFAGASNGVEQRGPSDRAVSPIVGVAGPAELGGDSPWITRSRVVEIDQAVLRTAAERVSDTPRLSLPLFDDLTVTLEVREADYRNARRFTIQGVVPRMIGSHATLTVWDSAVSGFIMLPQIGQFNIIAAGEGKYRILQIDPNLMPGCGVNDAHRPARRLRHAGDPEPPMAQSGHEPIEITLLAFYTSRAADAAGSAAEVVARVQSDVATTNTAFALSNINIVIKLLLVSPVPVVEGASYEECDEADPEPMPGCMAIDVEALQTPTDLLQGIHDWRSTLCADLVIMIVNYPEGSGEPCGIAVDIPSEPSIGEHMTAFAVVEVRCMPGTTTAHELGHLLGSAHDHAQGSGGGTYPYSHGHRFPLPGLVTSDPPWITIMSYPPGIPILRFSNPSVLFAGLPTGIPAGLPLEADNALTFTNNAPYVASYSYEVCLGANIIVLNPGDSIQAAIDEAQNGDQIVLSAGTYNEAINLNGKAIYLRSSIPYAAILDGTGLGESIITCSSGEGAGTVIHSLTIRNGDAVRGGGLYIKDSSPAIVDCIFEDNNALLTGGAVYLEHSYARFLLCEFIDNSTHSQGGAMYVRDGGPKVTACVFQGNEANVGSGGRGGAIYSKDSELVIWDSLIGHPDGSPSDAQRNLAGAAGGGIFIEVDENVPEQDWILPSLGSTVICGNVPNNNAGPWTDLGNNTVCALHFDIAVPGDYSTIQAAIDAAGHGDTILVAPGTYAERIDLKGKRVHLRSFDPTDPGVVASTIIDGQGGGTVVKCATGETSQTVISGFTITGGNAAFIGNLHGGGIRIMNGNPTIERCVLLNNHASSAGGGIYIVNGGGVVEHCTFIGNTTGTGQPGSGSGGGINVDSSPLARVRHCLFVENHSNSVGGGMANNQSNNISRDNIFLNNSANKWGGAMFNSGNPTVIDSTFTGNSALEGGGAIYTTNVGETSIFQSTFCENTPDDVLGPWFDLGSNDFFGTCPPLNNSPENAEPIGSPITTIVGSFTGATNSGSSSCDPEGVDVFYSYTVFGGPANLAVDTCGSTGDTNLAVFDSLGTELACNTTCAGTPCGGPSACITLAGLADGEYLIRVSRTSSMASGIGSDEFLLNLKEVKSAPGDLNLDGVVDVSDLLILLNVWGLCDDPNNCPSDLNGDGSVDVSDLLILLGSWG